ncbi:MAG: 2-C-methyl-D-erythritol 2,4-cyclodiphosphate synthase [Omnitrophica WOR_2 bacterium GWF2_43_52]|nr:MAG: 2-C-methyl-D-erythritol 2,4-cyclodiphosphate synthase [Omnitrophica WOR_2 bacterium GWC2_44_8]OGX21379.1 MAG: 2-C-methyl-D-erythritol 2,4-cyclodiphosphate synthase [Omnitrophica WOR_2 bacterium GWF2_43_52]OGX54820.1 MAG: 2-C-methyl-D-erythritol 2,4-cyclodiphosphate synthase [Omnitrophica WOR_2 bacterium RIFOXYC2_FULL_43_9]HAH21996.1 2-C-methyl-D-erythritol 2,4-cyclodiphosphate synthase [Candidatus Omnitrophota bacterium]HBG62673.1 2-C-methyl-D-erythritol 2,4-cyclodiphosphate synthase [C
MFRVGIGYDIHRLVAGRKLILGGLYIPFKKGLYAHSDGDVLLHALCDALLGAVGLGDIGIHFPNTDTRYKNISSLKLLEAVKSKISKAGYTVSNVDSVLIADRPKIGPYRSTIIRNISVVLKIKPAQVNVKATTSEGVGPVGSKAIASYAVALLERKR